MNYLVLDIETVPEPIAESKIAEWRAELEVEYAKPETVLKHLESRIQKSRFDFDGARPICLGMCVVSDRYGKDTETYTCLSNADSKQLVAGFADLLTAHIPLKLVGFNLKRFDLPILFRWLYLAGIELHQKFGRYDVIDLIEEVAGYGTRVSLERSCNAYGIKTSDGDGSMVEGWYIAKQWEQIEKYCLEDVKSTVELFKAVRKYRQF